MHCSHQPMLNLLLSKIKPLLQAALHLNTEHDVTWCRISHLIGCLGQAIQLLVKINSIPAEPRTAVKAYPLMMEPERIVCDSCRTAVQLCQLQCCHYAQM